jgi:putative transposase
MGEMRLEALYPKPKTSLKREEHKIYPYLLKDVEVRAPDRGLVHGYHLPQAAPWVHLLSGADGYLQSICFVVAFV